MSPQKEKRKNNFSQTSSQKKNRNEIYSIRSNEIQRHMKLTKKKTIIDLTTKDEVLDNISLTLGIRKCRSFTNQL